MRIYELDPRRTSDTLSLSTLVGLVSMILTSPTVFLFSCG